MIVNIAWRRSGCDEQVHAFPLAQIAEAGRGYLEAVCSHTAPPTALQPTVGRPSQNTCSHCLLIIDDRLADAGGDPGPHGTIPPP